MSEASTPKMQTSPYIDVFNNVDNDDHDMEMSEAPTSIKAQMKTEAQQRIAQTSSIDVSNGVEMSGAQPENEANQLKTDLSEKTESLAEAQLKTDLSEQTKSLAEAKQRIKQLETEANPLKTNLSERTESLAKVSGFADEKDSTWE